MTTFLFLRHAHSTANGDGVLAGRTSGISLSDLGRKQSRSLNNTLSDIEPRYIFSSPLERCLQTVEPLARRMNKKVRTLDGLIEMDYGLWSGKKLRHLAREPLWKKIQREPSSVIFPEGESFNQAWRRIETTLKTLQIKYPKSTLLLCTHGDITKMAIAMTVGLPLNDFQRIVIDPASLSVLHWEGRQRTLIESNRKLARINFLKAGQKHRKSLAKRRVVGGGSDV